MGGTFPDGLDGGAILDECGNFGVTDHGPPQFLAFNTCATLSNGATPQCPEEPDFTVVVDTMTINRGGSSASTITLDGYGAGGLPVGSQSLTWTSAL